MIPTATYPPHRSRYYNGGYRYFFNGQEADNEVLGDRALHAFEYRMHDTRLGRFWSVDPLAGKFPWNSVYAFAENQVVEGMELEGLEVVFNTSEFGSAVGAGRFGWNYVKGEGKAKDKAGITYFKYKSSFKISEEESVAGIMIANKSFHTGIDYSSDYFRQSTSKDGITNVELYPFGGISADGRWPDTYAGISFGIGLGIAISTTKTEIDASFSITYEERMKLIDLVIEKGFTYNDSDPKLEVIDQYLYYVDTGHIFNLFKETKIKTDIKMVNIEGEQWESVQYQQKVNDTLSK